MNESGGIDLLKPLVEEAYATSIKSPDMPLTASFREAIRETVSRVDRGQLRVAVYHDLEKNWTTQVWIKQAILLYFKVNPLTQIQSGPFSWIDKIPLKQWTLEMGVRSVPTATVRFGAHVAKSCVLMPCFVNIGAYVNEGTMVDTWATVGSCAQIGKNVHLSGGVGIGGVLEPPQAMPVIVEDNCFLGSRAIVVEGVRIQRGAVLGAGVVLTASTPIVDVSGSHPNVRKGVIPENSVVIPGTMPKKFPAGEYQVPCALIIGKRSASTDSKTSLNQALRDFEVSV